MTIVKSKVIIPLMGGLGNQLFQFAAGLHLRKFSSKHVKFSPSGLLTAKNTPRSFMLGDLLRKTNSTARGRYSIAILRIASFVCPTIWVSERDLHDFPLSRVTKVTKVLIGYFQRHDYVDSVATELIQSMSQSNTFKSLVLQPEKNDIAVHIRFGDYLSNSETKKFHGLSSMTYFVNAVNRLQSVHKFDRIVIYSDDLGKAYPAFT